jgi:tRNA A-37 threonylcarbamoyl transferase component Bud32
VLDDRHVLRVGGNPAREAELMERASAAGFPVPRIDEVRDDALVLELVDGPTMDEVLRRRPWLMRVHARLLASLHRQLAPTGLVHFDLNPTNVVLSTRGPVVLDWTNAREGDPDVDVALTYVILATSGGLLGRVFARLFARHVDVDAGLDAACAYRIADPNVTDAERSRVRRLLLRRAARRAGRSRA